MTIAGQIYPVTQELSCSYSISPTTQSFGSSGGTGSVSVTGTNGCSWTATSNATWITVTGESSDLGSGTVGYSVASNTDSSARTGTVTIAENTFTLTQGGSGGAPDINVVPMSYNFGYVTKYKSKSADITVTNTGAGPLTINSITFEGAGSIHYKQTNDCTPMEPGSSCTITATFTPTITKLILSTYLVISWNDPNENPMKILLQGKGIRY
jgi:hypothetical protein